jgi:cysteine desulfurase/selenocysteine lyase
MITSEFDNTLVGTELGDIGRLRQIASKFCPEEVKSEVRPMIPDGTDELNLTDLKDGFMRLLSGGEPFPELNYRSDYSPLSDDVTPAAVSSQPAPNSSSFAAEQGFGIGIPEIESVRNLKYEETDTVNTEAVRKDFPVLSQKVNGKPLVWFDNGATTQKPRQVIDAISDYYTNYNSNIHRGAHTLAAKATDAYEGAREKVRRFINAASVDEIIFVRGTTEGINLIAQTFGRKFVGVGDEVIVSTLDHHANIVPWQQICKEKGATLKAIPITQNGDLMLEEYERLITPKTKFVSVGHVNNTFGTINDVRRIIEIAHRHDIPVLIDGAQSIAHTPVDVQSLGADFFVFSGHKIYGPTGIGIVYGRKAMLDILPPWQGGGNMIKDVTIEETQFNEPPARFEAGTPNVADAIGLGAALDYVSRVGIPNIEHYEHSLTEYARQQLGRIKGVTIMGNPRHRVSVVSFELEGIPTPEVGQLLDKEGIAVRAGHHCAQPALRALGYEMSVRATFAFYNTKEEIDKLAIALQKILASRS